MRRTSIHTDIRLNACTLMIARANSSQLIYKRTQYGHKWNMLPLVLTGIVICFGAFLSLPGTLACNLSTDRDVICSLFFLVLTMSPAMGLENRRMSERIIIQTHTDSPYCMYGYRIKINEINRLIFYVT